MISVIAAAAAPEVVGMSGVQVMIAILGTSSLAAVAGAVVTGMFSRRKLGADATEIITRAASGVVEQVQEDNARLRAENVDIRTRNTDLRNTVDELRQMVEDHTRVLQLHVAWDSLILAKLAEAGVTDLPPAPPVYAPTGSPSRVRAMLDGETTPQ